MLFNVPHLAVGIWRLVRVRFYGLPIRTFDFYKVLVVRLLRFISRSRNDVIVFCRFPNRTISLIFSKMFARSVKSTRISVLVKYLFKQSTNLEHVFPVSHVMQS